VGKSFAVLRDETRKKIQQLDWCREHEHLRLCSYAAKATRPIDRASDIQRWRFKELLMDSAALLCPENKIKHSRMSTRRTVMRRIEEIAWNLENVEHFDILCDVQASYSTSTYPPQTFRLTSVHSFKLNTEISHTENKLNMIPVSVLLIYMDISTHVYLFILLFWQHIKM